MSKRLVDRRVEVYAVVRVELRAPIDPHAEELRNYINIKEVLPSLEEAETEVARLNKLNGPRGARYFWTYTRYFPEGKKVAKTTTQRSVGKRD